NLNSLNAATFVSVGGDKLTLSVTGPTSTTPIVTNSILQSPKTPEDTNQKRCTTPVTVTFFGHSERGKLEKVMITGPENKNKQPLSLLSTNGDIDTESLFNSLNFVDNLSRDAKSPTKVLSPSFIKDTNSNPFVNFNLENNTNPFHESNPFLTSNPFIRTDEV
ncbi:hypothetical protein AMK59_4717, partial [Oryctes borbonicus]